MHRSGWGRTLIAIVLGGALAPSISVLPAVGPFPPPHPGVDTETPLRRPPPPPDRAGNRRELLGRRGLQERRGPGECHPGRPARGLHHRGGVGAGGNPPARLPLPTVG